MGIVSTKNIDQKTLKNAANFHKIRFAQKVVLHALSLFSKKKREQGRFFFFGDFSFGFKT